MSLLLEQMRLRMSEGGPILLGGEVVYYDFEPANVTPTQVLDVSGNGLHATINGLPTFSSGPVGQGINLVKTSSDYLSCAAFGFQANSDFSAAYWLKTSSTQLEAAFNIGASGLSGTIKATAGAFSGLTYFDYGAESTGRTSGPYASYLGSWHLICVIGTQSYSQIKVDGVQIAYTTHASSPFPALSGLTLGRGWFGATYYCTGSIDDFRIFNRVLTAPEIAQLYAMGAA